MMKKVIGDGKINQLMSFKHVFMVVTTDFELEPLLEQYLITYPMGEYESYTIAFRTENEHREGHISYIVVFKRRKPKDNNSPRFSEYLEAHCKLNNQVAFANPVNHILPKIDAHNSGFKVFGSAAKYREQKWVHFQSHGDA